MSETPAIELREISKRFGAVQANKNINLIVKKGSIHGIIGENGAGKSTLMSILYGFYQADTGKVLVNGKSVSISDSKTAISLGVGMVHQHFMLIDTFSVLENVVLGAEDSQFLSGSLSRARKELKRLEDEYELRVDPDALVEDLPVGLQQRVEILKALYRKADVLILDEPTGVLTPAEADHLFKILDVLKAEGKTVLLITHKLREIMKITDTVSVMRRGEMVATKQTKETSMEELAELMVGRSVLLKVEKQAATPKEPVLEVSRLSVTDNRGVNVVKDVSFNVHAGEIVGIAGVSGNGQSELLEALSGIRSAMLGEIKINGEAIDLTDDTSNAAFMRSKNMGHVPEDRHRMGLINSFAEYDNSILGYHRDPAYSKRGVMDLSAIKQNAVSEIEKYDIRPQNPMLKTANFSGGNQQKIVLAREIERDPDILLVGQPTRGVDIGAIEFIHRRLIELRDQGKAILLVSVELDEIRALADRVLVMFDGQIVGERGASASEAELGLLMAGVSDTSAPTDGAHQ